MLRAAIASLLLAGCATPAYAFDGGSDRETHMDALTISVKFNWSNRGRNR